ncbi:MAG: hypothetical protein ABIS68_08035 [Casimicrobiaceae bacterium]
MNAKTQSNKARVVALVAAILTSATLFTTVASLGDQPQAQITVVAQSSAPVLR